MRRIQNSGLALVPLAVCILALVPICCAQDVNSSSQGKSQSGIIRVLAGHHMIVDGVIMSNQPDGIIVVGSEGGSYHVAITNATEMKERKSNPFRSPKRYSRTNLIPGLRVEVKGIGNTTGSITATEIRLRNDDIMVAQAMNTRMVPIENHWKNTQARLDETEQNAQRLSGQVQELSAVSNAARGGATAAQATADIAVNAANDARSAAEAAQAGVQSANERITSLDDYQVMSAVTVHFGTGSAALSSENRSKLEKCAEYLQEERGFLIEIAGFASSDGNEEYNRRLSQKRADAVIRYLAENYSIPLRRFVTPMGYGELRPVADNHTKAGRKENRRVEVRILVNKGLIPIEGSFHQYSGPKSSAASRME